MRSRALPLAGLTIVALLALAPTAAAQAVPGGTPLDPVVRPLRLAPGGDIADVRPLSGFGLSNLSVQVHCTALSAQDPTTVDLVVEGAPSYFTVSVTPASAVFPPNQPQATTPPTPPCANEFRVQDVFVFVSATGDAPAYVPSPFSVTGTLTGSDTTPVTAWFNASAAAFSMVDLAAAETAGNAEPSKPWRFDVTVTNRGNSKVDVALAGGAPRGIAVKTGGGPVGSKQLGDASNTATFAVEIVPEASVLNGRYPVWINATATIPDKPAIRADRDSVQLTVVVAGGAVPEGDEESALPAAALAAPVAFALAAAADRRRRTRA